MGKGANARRGAGALAGAEQGKLKYSTGGDRVCERDVTKRTGRWLPCRHTTPWAQCVWGTVPGDGDKPPGLE